MNEFEKIDSRIIDCIAKVVLNTASKTERDFLDQWLSESEENQLFFEQLQNNHQWIYNLKIYQSFDANSAWKELDIAEEKALLSKHLYIAAACILTLFGFLWLAYSHLNIAKDPYIVKNSQGIYKNDILPGGGKVYLKLYNGEMVDLSKATAYQKDIRYGTINDNELDCSLLNMYQYRVNSPMYNTLVVPKGASYLVILADGSRIHLNANSELRYPLTFEKNERKVFLEGEGYFEVSKDAQRPFKVITKDMEVKVFGTHFNIRRKENKSVVTLSEGSVQVNNEKQRVVLKPGYEAVNTAQNIVVEKANIEKRLAWKKGTFYFEHDSIESIITDVSNWYNISVHIRGKLPEDTISGQIAKDVPLSQVLQMLGMLSGAKFDLDERNLEVIF